VASRYSQRPSSLLGLHPLDPVALDFDTAIAHRALVEESNRHERAMKKNEEETGDGHAVDAETLTEGLSI
jgi:hypothetical protein